MVDVMREATKLDGNLDEKGIANLIQKAMKAKAGYDYTGALEIFDQAQAALDEQLRENGADEKKLLEVQYTIHDGRAKCYNWLADNNQELSELEIMAGLAAQMGDELRRINVINRQAEAMFVLGEFDEGERLSVVARELAVENGEQNEEAQSLMLLSQVQFQKGDSDKSHRNNKQALEIFRETGNLYGQSRCLRNMAFNGMRSGQTKNVQQYAEQALDLARQAGDHRSEADSLNVIGNISSDASQTRDNYKQALEIYTTIGDENGHKRVANNLSLLFWKLGLYGQANFYATRAEKAARTLGNKKALAVFLDGVGRSWFELGDLDRAEEVFQEGLILSREYADAFDVAACLMGLARIAHKRGDYQSAIDYFKEQVELLRGKGNVPEIAVVLAWMGAAYLKLGDHHEADQITSQAVDQLLTTSPNTDLLDQEVWWSRYQVLKAGSGSDPEKSQAGEEIARLMLEKAHRTMLDSIDAISDEGLRRNYLTKVPVNREIIQEWARLFHDRPEYNEFLQPKVTTSNLQEQFKRLSEIGSRLSTQRDPNALPDFIMNEVVELNGAERAFLVIFNNDGDLQIETMNGLSQDQADQIVLDENSLFSQTADTRYAILKERVGEVPKGGVPELHQRSVLVVPLVSQSYVLGVIYTDLRHIFGSFNQNDIDLLTVLANQAASALEGANWTRTLEQKVEERTTELGVANTLLEQQNADLALINEVQQGLAAKLNLQDIIELVGEKLITIFNNYELSIVLYDAESHLCHWAYAFYQGKRKYIDPLPPAGFTGHIIKTGDAIVINENIQHAVKEYKSEILADVDMPKSIAYVPIMAEGKVIGVIALSNVEKENAFDPASVRLVESLAASLGIALSNVRLFDETNQRAAELAVINSVQEGLAAQLDFDAIIELVGEKIREVFDAQGIGISLYDRQTNIVNSPYFIDDGLRVDVDPVPNPIGFTAHIIQTSQPLLVNQDLIQKMEELGSKWVGGTEQETRFSKSYLGVPIIIAGEVIGVISLTNYEREYAYSDSDVSLLTTLASSMSVALENARLFDETNRLLNETNQRAAELAIINSVQDGLAEELDIPSIFELVGEKIREIFDAQVVLISTFDHETKMRAFPYLYEKGRQFHEEPIPFNELSHKLISSRKPIVINEDMRVRAEELGMEISSGTEPVKSLVFVPMIIGDSVMGSVSLQNIDRENAFPESAVRLLITLTSSMSVALENARLFDETNRLLDETQQRNAELTILNSVGDAMAQKQDVDTITQIVGDKVRDIFKADAVEILLYDSQNQIITIPYHQLDRGGKDILPFQYGEGLTSIVIKTRQPLVFGTAEESDKSGAIRSLAEDEPVTESYIGVPIIIGERVLGVVSVQSYRKHAYDESSVRLLSTLASSMGVAIENARLFEEINQRAAELAVINSVQEGLAAELDIQAIYDLVGEKLREVFKTQVVAVSIYDHERGLDHCTYLFEEGELIYPEPHKLGEASQYFIKNRKPIKFDTLEEIQKIGGKVIEGTKAEKSGMWAPMVVGGIVMGKLSVLSHEKEFAFTDADLRLLTTLANSTSVALENARLFEETNQRAAELALINSVQQGLAAELEMQAIYDLVGDQIRDIFDAQSVAIFNFNLEQGLSYTPYLFEKGERFTPDPHPLRKIGFHLIETAQPVVINQEAELKKFDMKVVAGEMAKSLIFVPLLVGNQVKGAISLQNIDRENAFSDSDVRLLTTLANSMSVALENARLFDETNQRAAELAIINSVGEAMAKQLDIETISRIVGDKVRDIFEAEVTDILLFDQEMDTIKIVYGYDRGYLEDNLEFPFGQGLASKVIQSKKPLVLGSLEEGIDLGAHIQPNVAQDDQVVESYMGVPIIVGERVIGVVDVQSYQQKDFDDNSVRLLSTLAANMGVALENARLFQETNRRANETAALNDIGREISATLDQNAVLEQIARRAKEILSAKDVVLRLLQPDGSLPTVVAFGTNADNFRDSVLRLGEGITGHVAKSGEAEVIASSRADARASHVTGTDKTEDDTIIFAPLKVRDRVIGVMGLWRDIAVAGPFGDSDLKFAVGLAGQAAIAIENARLFTEIEQRASEMTALAEVGQDISATLDLQTVMERITSNAKELLKGDISAVFMPLEEDGEKFNTYVVQGNFAQEIQDLEFRSGEGILGDIVRRKTGEVINDANNDPRVEQIPGTEITPDEHMIVAPLLAQDELRGLLTVWRNGKGREFDQDDMRFLNNLAGQAALAIENARLFEEVQRQKQYSEALVKNSPVAIVTHDLDNNVVSWNPAAESLFGYREDEAIGVNTLDLISNKSIDEEMVKNFKKLANGGRVKTVTKRYRKDGSSVDVELLALPVMMEGKQVGLVSIYHDINELLEARHEAEAANEAKSAFLATMSHEIRTPMNAIIGMTGLLLETEMDAEQIDYTVTIRDSGDALLTIINDILDFSKIEAGKMELEEQPFDLRDCVESALDLMKVKAAETDIELAYLVEENVPGAIIGDVTRLRQIMINLINNALKFTKQGEVILSVSNESVLIEGKKPHRQELKFSVRDTGIGIPPKRMDRLFQAFSQVDASTSRKYGGTGLGLAISKRLTEMMGGEMWVESSVGVGTTFYFTIRAEKAPEIKKRPHLAGEQAELLGKRVLVVDDNETNRRILTLQGKTWGMRIQATESPKEALMWIKRDDPFDLAILDMNMPEMNGVELAATIRELRDAETLPLVLFTSLGSREIETGEVEFAAQLQKPLKPSVLFDILMEIFAGQGMVAVKGKPEKPTKDPKMAERHPLRILLAEDNVVNQKLALKLLSQMGYRADVAGNGLEAIQAIERQKYDLVFMDVQMPEMDGLEATRQICSRWSRGERPRIVAMTANAMQGDRERCLEAGMDDYVSKPVRVEELISALDRTQILK